MPLSAVSTLRFRGCRTGVMVRAETIEAQLMCLSNATQLLSSYSRLFSQPRASKGPGVWQLGLGARGPTKPATRFYFYFVGLAGLLIGTCRRDQRAVTSL